MDRRTIGFLVDDVASPRVVAAGGVAVRDACGARVLRVSVAARAFSAETSLVSFERFLEDAGVTLRECRGVDGALTDERAASRRVDPLRAILVASHTLHEVVPHKYVL